MCKIRRQLQISLGEKVSFVRLNRFNCNLNQEAKFLYNESDLCETLKVKHYNASKIRTTSICIHKIQKRIEILFSQEFDHFLIRRNYAKTFVDFKRRINAKTFVDFKRRILTKITSLTIVQYINKFIF